MNFESFFKLAGYRLRQALILSSVATNPRPLQHSEASAALTFIKFNYHRHHPNLYDFKTLNRTIYIFDLFKAITLGLISLGKVYIYIPTKMNQSRLILSPI